MVQDILNDMDSDNVNSINDTVEALQVTQILKTTYFELMASKKWPHLKVATKLEASGDNNKPTHMKMPELMQFVENIFYNKQKSTETRVKYDEIIYCEPDEFLELLNSRNQDDTNITKYSDYSGIDLLIATNVAPTYYTSFDDEYLVFDSYDSDVDTTLQASKTQIIGYKEPTWTTSDTFIPDMPSKYFPMLQAETKATCFASIKQMPNVKEEQKARRQRTWLSREKWRQNGGIKFPDYGRK